MNSRDVAAQACDDGGYLYQLARLVVQLHFDGAETTALHQTAVDDTVEDGYVDVTAAYHADGLLALHRHLVVHHGSHACCSGTFSHHLLAFEELQDGCADLVLAYGDDFIHIVGAGFEGELSRFLHGDAVGYGCHRWQLLLLVVVETLNHAGCSLCLDSIDLDVRVERLDGESDSRNQSAATYRYYHSFHIRQLVEDFQSDGSLSGNHLLVIERMHEGIAVLIPQLQRLLVSVIIDTRNQADLCTQTLGCLYLGDRGTLGQTDEALHSHGGSAESHTLCVVACRTGNHTFLLLFLRELGNLIVCTSNLERPRLLEAFRFQINITIWVDSWCMNQLSFSNHVAQHEAGLVEIVKL